MLDPSSITKFNRTDYELQEVALFWILAAGKNGTVAARLLDSLLSELIEKDELPFDKLKEHTVLSLATILKSHGIGCQTSKSRSMIELAKSEIDLRTCLPQDLEAIHGIGKKTSRCFIIHSRENANYAALDTHILKFLREQGFDAPKSTPASAKTYAELEEAFLKLAKESGKSVAGFDLEIWNRYAVR